MGHDQWAEGEAFEKAQAGASGVEKVIQVYLTTQEVVIGSRGCGDHWIRDRFAGQEGRKLCGAARGSRRNLKKITVLCFSSVARVASIHGELLASVVVVDRGCAVPGLLEINGRAAGKVCRSREREGNLVRASEQRRLIGIDVVADSIGVIQGQVWRLLDKDFLELMSGDDIKFSQLPWTSKRDFIGAKLVQGAAVRFGWIGIRDRELVRNALQENIECGRADRLGGEIVPLLGPCVQLTAIGLLNSIFEDDGERQSAAASRRVYRTEDKARFAVSVMRV